MRFLAPLALAAGLFALPAPAATIDFIGFVNEGAAAGEIGLGQISFDDALLSGSGVEFLFVEDGISLSFSIFGQSFTEADDLDFDFNPSIGFIDGTLSFIEFQVSEVASEFGSNVALIDDPRILGFALFNIEGIPGGFGGDVTVDYAAVPLPASLPLLLAGLGGLALLRRRAARA